MLKTDEEKQDKEREKEGKHLLDNLKYWLLGVPGAHGNLQFMGISAVMLPP